MAIQASGIKYQVSGGKTKIEIKQAGTYEFWVDVSELEEIPELEVDGQQIAVGDWGIGRLGDWEIGNR